MSSRTFKTTIVRDGSMCFIPLTFDPKSVFGKIRAPVKVTLNGYTYRSTIASMGGPPCIPLRRSNREAAGLEGGETIDVRLDLDTEKREIKPPADFVRALKAAPPAWERWRALSYSHQREHVEAIEEARKPATRARRIETATRMISSQGTISRKNFRATRPKASVMAASRTKPATIDEYLAALTDDKRVALEKLRRTIRAAAPKAEECISYQLPAFRQDGMLVAFGATANHCTFYLMSGSTVDAHKDDLKNYDTSKGAVRFQPDKPLPAALVRKLVKARIAENKSRRKESEPRKS